MKHNTRKLVSFLASRHQVKQVTSWSASLAAAGATRTVTQPKAPHWHGHTAAFPGAGEITPVWASLREMLRTFFLILLSVFITGHCPCAPPLPVLSPVPFCFTHGISRQVWARPAECRRPVLTALMVLSKQHVSFGCLFWMSLFMAFKQLAVTLANSSPHAGGRGTLLKGKQKLWFTLVCL